MLTFATLLALGVVAFVAAPWMAHRLRRRMADERRFPAAHLVPKAEPKARRRSRLEDRALFGVRAACVVALALLGATPFARCSRLSLSRSGASVAVCVVLDDSMSMRAKDGKEATRFDRAKKGATDLFASLKEGDAAAIVLAGAPPRVALASTTDIDGARAALASVEASDRGTDLEGALGMARTLIADLPQVDKRVVLLSDLADGSPQAAPLALEGAIPAWNAMPELAAAADDCAVLAADRLGNRVRVKIQCTPGAVAAGREVRLTAGERVIAKVPATGGPATTVTLTMEKDEPGELAVTLAGDDAIREDDTAPVVLEGGSAAIAVVSESSQDGVVTGGAPAVEQALRALGLDLTLRALPVLPDQTRDLALFAGVVVDDPPGLTPEQRRALAEYMESGGLTLVGLGRRAGAAPLGAGFEPILTRTPTYGPSPAKGAAPSAKNALFVDAVATLDDLAPRGRARLAPEDSTKLDVDLTWTDGAPLLARRAVGRGEAWVVTLPLRVDESDLPLRPGFLSLLDAFADEARRRTAPRRVEVGAAWVLAGARKVAVRGPAGPVKVTREEGGARVVPSRLGAYRLELDDKIETRVVAPAPREIDLRPRAVPPTAQATSLGDSHAKVDVSWLVALALLVLVGVELALRAFGKHSEDADAPAVSAASRAPSAPRSRARRTSRRRARARTSEPRPG